MLNPIYNLLKCEVCFLLISRLYSSDILLTPPFDRSPRVFTSPLSEEKRKKRDFMFCRKHSPVFRGFSRRDRAVSSLCQETVLPYEKKKKLGTNVGKREGLCNTMSNYNVQPITTMTYWKVCEVGSRALCTFPRQ